MRLKTRFALPVFTVQTGSFMTVQYLRLAAANWLASADYLRAEYPDAVLLDIGSTTADVIPLARFASMKGLTDLRRLQRGISSTRECSGEILPPSCNQ